MMGDLLSLLDNDDDVNNTADDAAGRAGEHGSTEMFKTAMTMLSSNKQKVVEEDIDEDGKNISRQKVEYGRCVLG
jgi:hypothetical protein